MLHLLRRLFATQSSARSAIRPRPVRLGLESLDERVLLSATPLGDITGYTYGNQYATGDRTVARSISSGDYVFTWEASGSGGGIYARLFRSDGVALTAPIHLGSTNDQADWCPSVAMNGSGQFAVAWTHKYSDTDLDVHVQRFNANGTLSGSE